MVLKQQVPLQRACAAIPRCFHKAPAPQSDHPAYPKRVPWHSHCCMPETGNLEVTSNVGQSTAHKAQPYHIHQEQPGRWEQQTSTIREPTDASRNLSSFYSIQASKDLDLLSCTYYQDNRESCLNPGQNVSLSAPQNT